MGRIEDIDAKLEARLQAIDAKVGGRMAKIDGRVGGPGTGGGGAEGGEKDLHGAWGAAGGAARGVSDSPWDLSGAEGEDGIRRLGLCVGLNEVDASAYPGGVAPLGGCVADAERFLCVMRRLGFAALKLLDAMATCFVLYRALAAAAEALRPGDLFVVHVSGHGGREELPGGGFGGNWCLYDGPVRADDVTWMLSRFRPGVRVLMVNDQCHSGGMFQTRGADGGGTFARLCADDGRPAGWNAGAALRSPSFPMLIQFAACRAEQTSIDGLGGGTWTQALVNALDDAWARGARPSYRQWFDAAFASPTLRRGRQDPQWIESATVTDAFRGAAALR